MDTVDIFPFIATHSKLCATAHAGVLHLQRLEKYSLILGFTKGRHVVSNAGIFWLYLVGDGI